MLELAQYPDPDAIRLNGFSLNPLFAQKLQTCDKVTFGCCLDQTSLDFVLQAKMVKGGIMHQPKGQVVAHIYLLGPFAVRDASGSDCTPKGRKVQALVALLALAPRGIRSRAWLRDKLWSDRGEEQASASLRQALVEVRRAFRRLPKGLVTSDRLTVSIDLTRLSLDLHDLKELVGNLAGSSEKDAPFPDLLEGIDIRDPEFEDWLSLERRFWHSRLEQLSTDHAPPEQHRKVAPFVEGKPEASSLARVDGFGLGLLPKIDQEAGRSLSSLADLVLEAIAKNLQELQPLDIYDFRDSGFDNLGINVGAGPDILLRIRVREAGSDASITLLAYRTSTSKLVWSHSVHADQEDALRFDSVSMAGFINYNVDRIAHAFFASPDPDSGAKTSYVALNLIFQVDSDSLTAAEGLLTNAYRTDHQSVYLGLLAYASSFRVGEHLGEFSDVQRTATIVQADEALQVNPFNSITLACIGHVHGFVLRDLAASGDLLKRAIEINPLQAFAWDHFALFNIYTGNYREAIKAARRAVLLGSFSPIRYSFETTLAMAATLLGDYPTAIHFANRALSRQPRFTAAMRYLIACYGHMGCQDGARDTLIKLHKVNPDFSQTQVRENSMAIIDDAGRQRLIEGFALAGVRK